MSARAACFFAEHRETGFAFEHRAHRVFAGRIGRGHPVAGRLLALIVGRLTSWR